MKPIIKRFAVVSSVAAASVGSLFVQTLTNAGSLPNSENGFSSDSTIKTVYTETVDTADNKVVDIFDNKAIAITGLDVYASAEEGAEVVGKLEEKNIADVISNEDGMTLVQSGNVKGYVKSENLVIGDEAEAVAYNLGNVTASIKADNTELYAKDKKETVKTVDADETLKVVSTAENQLVVQLDDNVEALVNTDQVDVDFGLETGKTSSEIAAEEAAKKIAERRKEKLTKDLVAVVQKSEYTVSSAVLQVRRSNRTNQRIKQYLKDLAALKEDVVNGKKPVSAWEEEARNLKKQYDKDLIETGKDIDKSQRELDDLFPDSWNWRYNELVPGINK